MAKTRLAPRQEEALLDVRQAAHLVGRSPETIRRWVWSGRLVAQRRGQRLVVSRDDLLAVAPLREGRRPQSLAEWARAVSRAPSAPTGHRWRSAADLVLADRRRRSEEAAGS